MTRWPLHERAGYRMGQDRGLAVTEARFPGLAERADALMQAIFDKLHDAKAPLAVA
jgi:hypothetical protein